MIWHSNTNAATLADITRNRLTPFGEPSDVGYATSRELSYGDTFGLAAVPGVVRAADRSSSREARRNVGRLVARAKTRRVMVEVRRPA